MVIEHDVKLHTSPHGWQPGLEYTAKCLVWLVS
jgi:hypothetical protein